uniref:Putative acrylyl-CoA reductase AcuI n=1 Tax=uncultured bacterium pBIO2154 TaxID=1478045 RepID=A0A075FBY5_9BACT|nr:putative acrylyl-CoA reductase AcuI [uncultured bacterium pBIO2154]
MEHAKSYRIFNENNKIEGRVSDVPVADIGRGEVVFKTAYSSVNFKDALAATGVGGKIIRNYPLIGGIDAAGTVTSSSDARFKAGDEIICTSYDMGVAHDGGFSEVCRVPADWVVPLPKGLTLFDAMALGTAGYTAGLAVELLELNGMAPNNGKVLVNGATGGVASLAIDMLAALGYPVTAVTGKVAEHDFLRKLGAAEILDRASIDFGTRPLEKPLWAAAFDSVGGDQLAWLTRTMQPQGLIASFGNAGGIDLKTSVLPFILRGVRLIGVDSAVTPMVLRKRVWARLASDLKPRHLADIAQVIGLADLPDYFARMVKGGIRGRAVVRMS